MSSTLNFNLLRETCGIYGKRTFNRDSKFVYERHISHFFTVSREEEEFNIISVKACYI